MVSVNGCTRIHKSLTTIATDAELRRRLLGRGASSVHRSGVGLLSPPIAFACYAKLLFPPSHSYSNTIQSMLVVLEALPHLGLALSNEHQAAASLVERADPHQRSVNSELLQALVQLRQDPAIVKALGGFCAESRPPLADFHLLSISQRTARACS